MLTNNSVALSDPEVGASLIDAAGRPEFATRLLRAARCVGDIEEVFASLIPPSGPPIALCTSGSGCDSGTCARNYARGYYRHDPMVAAFAQASRRSGFAHQVRAEDIGLREYRVQCFERPRYSDKLSFGWKGDSHAVVLSFYRRDATDDAALSKLGGLAELGLAALVRNLRHIEDVATVPLVTRLEAQLRYRFPMLTERELQVCAQTLAGLSADEAGLALGITRASVLTYRRRAYARLGYSKAAQFLDAIVT